VSLAVLVKQSSLKADNVNFYHYPSYISLAKSSLPKLLTYLILNFALLL